MNAWQTLADAAKNKTDTDQEWPVSVAMFTS
ncbi:hypothetical protein GGE48_005136 [Rhizobium leguminosarum]|nr:hypothetical protein [Rhizobium leguminosarum]